MCSITDCISEKKNAQVDNAKDTDAVMSMYNFMLSIDFNAADAATNLFKIKVNTTGKTDRMAQKVLK